jgi:zinc transporter 1
VTLTAILVRLYGCSATAWTDWPSQISEKTQYRQDFSFGWQRARIVGAFFNGAFLLALGFSILLQSIERFVSLKEVEDPMLILIMGGIGFGLNIITGALLHGQHVR